MKKVIAIFFLLILAYSCSGKKKNDIKDEKPKVEVNDIFTLSLEIEYLKDDHIELFYLEDYEELGFNGKQSFKKEIVGKEGLQEVVFEFPEKIYPEKLRLDFGSNIKQEKIKISKILIFRKNDSIIINQENFNTYFSIGRPIISTEDYYNFELRSHNNHYDPLIVSRDTLNEIISFF